jgi:hypothetical protein
MAANSCPCYNQSRRQDCRQCKPPHITNVNGIVDRKGAAGNTNIPRNLVRGTIRLAVRKVIKTKIAVVVVSLLADRLPLDELVHGTALDNMARLTRIGAGDAVLRHGKGRGGGGGGGG